MPTNVGALSMTRLRWCGLSRPGDRSGCGDTAGEAPCSASALVDLWASGLSPAYPIPVPDRGAPAYEGREALEAAAAWAGQAGPAASPPAPQHHRRAAFLPRPARERRGAQGGRALGGGPAELQADPAGAG